MKTKTKLSFIFCWGCLYLNTLAGTMLDRKIDVHFQGVPLKSALEEVSQKGDFIWSYNADIVEGNKSVSLTAARWTVREVLLNLLGENYQFKPSGKYLILKKLKKNPAVVSGYVKDPATGKRLAGATVYDRKTLRSTVTDSNGYYELHRVRREAEIVVAKLDYADTVLQVSSISPRFVKIDLQPVSVARPNRAPIPEGRIDQSLVRSINRVETVFNDAAYRVHQLNVRDSLSRHFQLSFVPYLGTNHRMSAKVANSISVNVLAGVSKRNDGVEVAGLGNVVREDIFGIQAAGVFNVVRYSVNGLQAGGVVNTAGGTLRGVQAAGVVNVAEQTDNASIQAAGVINVVDYPSNGVQVAGVVNVSNSQYTGIQVSGVVNHADRIKGIQGAGILNIADDMQGIQVAAIHNRVKKGRGIQIGLINTAADMGGIQIGLINRNGKRVFPLIQFCRKKKPN